MNGSLAVVGPAIQWVDSRDESDKTTIIEDIVADSCYPLVILESLCY